MEICIIFASFFPIIAHTSQDPQIRMTVAPSKVLKERFENVDLHCDFLSQDFQVFRHPVFWFKSQGKEKTDINHAGIIQQPFLNTKRFSINFLQAKPTYKVILSIKNLHHEDSGNYTCYIRGAKTTWITSVTHSLYVRDTEVAIVLGGKSNDDDEDQIKKILKSQLRFQQHKNNSRAPTEITTVEHRPTSISCISEGGYPPPDLSITFNGNDLSSIMQTHLQVVKVGSKGLKRVSAITKKWSNSLMFKAENDQQVMTCRASVSGLITNATSESIISVFYSPKIECFDSWSLIGERNVKLRCVIRARPSLLSLYWSVDRKGTAISQGSSQNEFWILVTNLDDRTTETKLFIRRALRHRFKSYVVHAENEISSSSQTATLKRKESLLLEQEWRKHRKFHKMEGGRVEEGEGRDGNMVSNMVSQNVASSSLVSFQVSKEHRNSCCCCFYYYYFLVLFSLKINFGFVI